MVVHRLRLHTVKKMTLEEEIKHDDTLKRLEMFGLLLSSYGRAIEAEEEITLQLQRQGKISARRS